MFNEVKRESIDDVFEKYEKTIVEKCLNDK